MFWQSPIGQAVLGVLVNLATVVFFAILALLMTARWWRRSRRSFFGITTRELSEIRIHVGNFWINHGGTTANVPISKGFQGPAIAEGEFKSGLWLSGKLAARPVARLVGAVGAQFGADSVLNPVAASVSACPPPGRQAEAVEMLEMPGCCVLIGGPMYNSMVHALMDRAGIKASRAWMERAIEPAIKGVFGIRAPSLIAGSLEIEVFTPGERHIGGSVAYDTYYLVEKITNFGPKNSTIFICAGLSNAATAAAVEELGNWRRLRSEFGDSPFSLVCKMVTASPDDFDARGRIAREWQS